MTKKNVSISNGCFPLKSFEEIEEFERKALNTGYMDDVVSSVLYLSTLKLFFSSAFFVAMIGIEYQV